MDVVKSSERNMTSLMSNTASASPNSTAKAKLLVFRDQTDFACIESIRQALKKTHGVEQYADFAALRSAILATPASIVLVSLRNVDHLRDLLELSDSISSKLEDQYTMIIPIIDDDHPRVNAVLKRMGCPDIFNAKANDRGLIVKVERFLGLVARNFALKKKPVGLAALDGGAGNLQLTGRVQMVAELQLSSDFWLLHRDNDARKVMGKWFIEMIGPSSHMGRWHPLKSTKEEGERWEFRVEGSGAAKTFYTPDGRWVFFGAKPEFNYEACKWVFISDRPRLVFVKYNEGIALGSRFELSPSGTNLEVSFNSKTALDRMPFIRSSYELEYRIQPDHRKSLFKTLDDLAKENRVPDAPTDQELDHGRMLEIAHDLEKAIEEARRSKSDRRTPNAPPPIDELPSRLIGKIPQARIDFYKQVQKRFLERKDLFNKTESKRERERYFRIAAKNQEPGVLWLKDRSLVLRLVGDVVDYKTGDLELRIFDPVLDALGEIDRVLDEVKSRDVYFNLKLTGTSVFFRLHRSKLRGRRGRIVISLPEAMYEVQRRNGLRLPIYDLDPVTFSAPEGFEKGVNWKLNNLGPGGFGVEAIFTSATQLQKFDAKVGKIFKAAMVVDDIPIQCSVRIRWLKRYKDENTVRLAFGVEYVDLPETDRQDINLFVLERQFHRLKEAYTED